ITEKRILVVGLMCRLLSLTLDTGKTSSKFSSSVGDSGRYKDKTDFPTLTRVSYCQCRLRKVFGSIFRQFDWQSITLIMNRDDMFGLVLGTTLDVGLQRGGYYPQVIRYYGRRNPSLKDLLRQASSKSRAGGSERTDVVEGQADN
ncbi:hypothetical protein LSAT2_025942, partial [Lamellibrachia satsuma]